MLSASHRKWMQNFYRAIHVWNLAAKQNKNALQKKPKFWVNCKNDISELHSAVQGMWGEGCALAYGTKIVWAMGQGHPQLGNGLWETPTATLIMPNPPVFRQGINTSSSHQENLMQVSFWGLSPWKENNYQSCQSSGRFTTRLQTFSALRKENSTQRPTC